MTLKETGMLLVAIAGVFDTRFEVTSEKINIWHMVIGRYDYQTASKALARWLSKPQDFPPQPGHINDEILRLVTPERDQLPWTLAWNALHSAMMRHGQYEVAEAIAKLTPRTLQALGGLPGYLEFCQINTDQLNTFRAQFRQRYEQLSECARYKALESPIMNDDVKAIVDATVKSLTPGGTKK